MKKILKAIALMICLLFPLSVMAMTTIEDSDLSTVTGQSGVSINLDVNLDLHMDTAAWGDSDGLGAATNTTAGWVGLKDLDATGIRVRLRQDAQGQIDAYKAYATGYGGTVDNFFVANGYVYKPSVWAIVDANDGTFTPSLLDFFGPYSASIVGALQGASATDANAMMLLLNLNSLAAWKASNSVSYYASMGAADSCLSYVIAYVKPLTIDVATGTPKGSAYTGQTYVHIGTGSLELNIASLDAKVEMGPGASATAPNLNQQLGSLYIGGLQAYINGASFIDIYKVGAPNDGTTGVAIGFEVTVDKVSFDEIAWGDGDGVDLDTAAGWVGLVTDTSAPTVAVSGGTAEIQNLQINGVLTIDVATSSNTFVQIGYSDLSIFLGQLDANVALGATKTNLNNVLGTLYVSNLNVTLANGSINISAPATGSGVIVGFNVTADVTADTVAWGDLDGIGSGSTQGWVGLTTLVVDDFKVGGQLTVDVATATAGNTQEDEGITFVRLGFGSGLQLSMASMDADVQLGSARTALDQTLGHLAVVNLHDTTVLGWVDIHAHSASSQGVVLNMNVTVNTQVDTVAWGDSNGLANLGVGNTTAGWVGLALTRITK